MNNRTFDVNSWRNDFPALRETMRGKPLIFFDNASTTFKPQCVLDAMLRYYTHETSNVHRGVYELSEKATAAYEGARVTVKRFINAAEPAEIIFTRGTTEAINLVAASYGHEFLHSGDEILVSEIEHHSNIVPWQLLCGQTGARLKVIPVNDAGEIDLDKVEQLCTEKTKLIAVAHVSNAIGTIHPVKKIVEIAHRRGAKVLIDGAQSAPHIPVDVRELDCDFYAFSGHKLYGPTGIGVLYGKANLLEKMPPFQGGGDMIRSVSFEETTYGNLPYKFEAGTPHIAGAIGLGAAIDYVTRLGLDLIAAHERKLLSRVAGKMTQIRGIRRIGFASEQAGILSFVVEGVHPHDVATMLDAEGIAIRAGHHCAMPAMNRFGVPATARISFGLYNTEEEIDRFAHCLEKVPEFFR